MTYSNILNQYTGYPSRSSFSWHHIPPTLPKSKQPMTYAPAIQPPDLFNKSDMPSRIINLFDSLIQSHRVFYTIWRDLFPNGIGAAKFSRTSSTDNWTGLSFRRRMNVDGVRIMVSVTQLKEYDNKSYSRILTNKFKVYVYIEDSNLIYFARNYRQFEITHESTYSPTVGTFDEFLDSIPNAIDSSGTLIVDNWRKHKAAIGSMLPHITRYT